MKPSAVLTTMILGATLALAGCAQLGFQDSALSTPIATSEVD